MVENALCPFCQELDNVDASEFRLWIPKSILPDRIIRSTQNFVALAGLGAMRPGYILIIPKAHIMSFSFLGAEFTEEAQRLKKDVVQLVMDFFSTPIIFEHGRVSPVFSAGGSIPHAHLHIFPTKVDLFLRLSQEFKYRTVQNLPELSYFCSLRQPYIYYEKAGKGFGFIIDRDIPSQYMRRLLWEEEGRSDEWDWTIFKGTNSLVQTVRVLRG